LIMTVIQADNQIHLIFQTLFGYGFAMFAV